MPRNIEIYSWQELISFLRDIRAVDVACRGEDRKFSAMKSKIDRCVKLDDLPSRLRMERALCQRFREHAPTYLSSVEQRYLATRWLQLVVMQHYGAPTRLLDWSKSPWVAAFFSAFGSWECDGYLYGFRRDLLERTVSGTINRELTSLAWGPNPSDMTFSDKQWDTAETNETLFRDVTVKRLSDWVATYYCRESHFPRLVAQQGFFTFASKPDLDHWQRITNLLGPKYDDECFVLEIKSAAKPTIIRGLNSIGLNGATLFPGPDGIGRSLEGFARAWALEPKPSQY